MVRIIAFLVAALCWAGSALAQAYPDRPVRIVVPFPPGGAVDILGRMVAQQLGEKWKQSVVVDNRPGGGTVLGASLVAKSPPDGYTILLTVTAHTVNATLMEKLPFDPIKDFAPITMAASGLTILVVNPALPVSCDREFTGSAGLTTRMVSPDAAIVIGAKSLIGSNGSFSMSVAFTVCAVTVRRIV